MRTREDILNELGAMETTPNSYTIRKLVDLMEDIVGIIPSLGIRMLTPAEIARASERRDAKTAEARRNDQDEAMAEIAYMAGRDGLTTEDSRFVISTFVRWAREFNEKNRDVVFDCSDDEHDYIIQVEKFYEERRAEAYSAGWTMKKDADHVTIGRDTLLEEIMEWEQDEVSDAPTVEERAKRLVERIVGKAI